MAWRVECLLVMAIVASTAPCTADWTVMVFEPDVNVTNPSRLN